MYMYISICVYVYVYICMFNNIFVILFGPVLVNLPAPWFASMATSIVARLWDLTSSLYGTAVDADVVGFLMRHGKLMSIDWFCWEKL